MTLFEALTGGAFDRLNWQHSEEFDQNFSKKSNAPGFAWWEGGGMGGFGIDRYIRGQEKDEKDQKMVSHLPRFIFFKTLFTYYFE